MPMLQNWEIFSWFLRPPELGSGALRWKQMHRGVSSRTIYSIYFLWRGDNQKVWIFSLKSRERIEIKRILLNKQSRVWLIWMTTYFHQWYKRLFIAICTSCKNCKALTLNCNVVSLSCFNIRTEFKLFYPGKRK